MFFLKKTWDDAKNTKRLTEIQVLTKEPTSYKIRYVFKKKKVTQLNQECLVKPIND